MKKLINDPDAVVREALEGMEAAHGDRLRVSYDPAFVIRADAPVQGKVAIISGGGSGHEPMHGGFVGPGMLDAACPGEVFTSPTPDQMLDATKAVNGGAGVLHIVKNYTGDVMNFEMAAELGGGEGIEVEAVVIDDDVAVQDSLYTAGRRGTNATLVVEKVAGALAEEGGDLAAVAAVARKANERARSLTRRATPATAATSSPRSDAAPASFSARTVAPTPRRPAVYSESCTATSSSTSTDSTRMPSSAASSAASLKFITSPV